MFHALYAEVFYGSKVTSLKKFVQIFQKNKKQQTDCEKNNNSLGKADTVKNHHNLKLERKVVLKETRGRKKLVYP